MKFPGRFGRFTSPHMLLSATALILAGVSLSHFGARVTAQQAPLRSAQRRDRDQPVTTFSERERSANVDKEEDDDPGGAADFFRFKRLPAGQTELPMEKYASAYDRMRRMRRYSTARGRSVPAGAQQEELLGAWTPLGPGNIGGRTRSIIIHPTTPSTMYAAAVAGGVWKTINSGASWTPTSDLIANLAVTALAMDPSNPNVLYAGTGEPYSGDGMRGNGVFKTTDGGANWLRLVFTANNSNFYYVNDLVISPNNSQRVYAATYNGIFRSVDGGTSWTQALGQPFCTDLVIRTDQTADYLFATCRPNNQGTIYRNVDAGGGGTWNQVFTEAGMVRTSLAVAPSNQSVVYAIAESSLGGPGGNYSGALHAVFRSTQNGDSGTWVARVRNTDPVKLNTLLLTNIGAALREECGNGTNTWYNQGWYDNVIAVDPADPNRVFVGGVYISRSDDGGATWGYAPCSYHVDIHALVFHPQYNGTTNKTMFFGGDGGIYRTNDARASLSTALPCNATCSGTITFTGLNNNYGVTQFYHGVPYPDGTNYFGGTQDNGTLRGKEIVGSNWSTMLGGDGGYVAIDAVNTNTLYAEFQNLAIQKSVNGGSSWSPAISGINNSGFLFIVPFIMDPTNSQRLWTGGSVLWRTSNGASSWVQASGALPGGGGGVSAIAVAPTNADAVLAGLSGGYILRTGIGTTSNSSTTWPSVRPRNGYVSWLTYDPGNANIAYATYSTFGSTGGDRHVYKSTDGGASWAGIDGTGVNSIPDVPVHCLVVDPLNTQRLYIGTDVGVFVSTDGGATWAVENTGFANVITESLSMNTTGPTRFLFAFTHGRGAWRVPLSGSSGCAAASAVSPSVTAVGSTVTITGSGLIGATGVTFSNNVNAPDFIVNSDTQITVTVPAGATNGPITVSKQQCPEVQTPALSLCTNPPVTLAIDDGSWETSISFGQTQTYFVNRLTPASYPATLSQVSISFSTSIPTGTNVDVLVGTNAGGGTNINNVSFRSIARSVIAQNVFVTYDILPPVQLNSGDYVVGFRVTPASGVFPASVDRTLPMQMRSYVSTNGTTFTPLETAFPTAAGNYLIRATVFPGTCDPCQAITISPATLPSGQFGVAYSQGLTASGGTAPYTFSLAAGSSLPAGLILSGATISGSPGSGGTFNLSVKATDANGCQGTRDYSLSINCPTAVINPTIQSFPSIGGPGSVNVTLPPGCAWMAASNAMWITINSGASGSGNGMVGFTVNANTSGGTRMGTMTIANQTFTVDQAAVEYEGDVALRPNGSGTVVVSDWVQVGRFSVGMDTPAPGSEAQRADCAPRSTLGDGHINVADWVQAGRYSVGLDPLTPAGGPTQITMVEPKDWKGRGTPRDLRIAGQVIWSGQDMVSVPVELVTQGGENGITFSVHYDPSVLSYEGCVKGRDVGMDSELIVRTEHAAKGRLGFGIALRPGEGYVAGRYSAASGSDRVSPASAASGTELVRVKFKVLNVSMGTTELRLGDGPTALGLADMKAQTLSLRPISGIVISGNILTLGHDRSQRR